MFQLNNKSAIITGAGSGIGKAIARVFAQQGATVHILDYDESAGSAVAEELKAAGTKAFSYKADVSNEKEMLEVISKIAVANNNTIDILVNNAGVAHVGTVENTSNADFQRLLDINVTGVFNGIKSAIPYMKENGGAILNMASIASSVGIPDRFAYSTTKGAIVGITLSVAKDYLPFGIRCNCISPARVHTPFVDGFISKNYPGNEAEMFDQLSKTQPIGRMAKPEEIAHLVLYLCSDEAGFISGNDYAIDGGFIKLNN